MRNLSPLAKYGIAGISVFVVLLIIIAMAQNITQPASETEQRTDELRETIEAIPEN